MNIKEQIKKDLILDAIENYKIILKLINSNPEIVSMIVFQYLPYLSLNLLDILDVFGHIESANNDYPQNIMKFSEIMKINRLLLKQETDTNKYKKIKKQILSLLEKNYNYLTKDYNDFQNLFIKLYGQKDFAVFSFKGIPFFNNIQYMRFTEIFINKKENISKDLIQITSSMTSFLQKFISIHINNYNFEFIYNESIKYSELDFDMNDYYVYDESRNDLFLNDLSIDQNTFLFNLICSTNSANYLYPYVFKLKGSAMDRMRYITYLTLIKGLWIYNNEFRNLNQNLEHLINKSDVIFQNDENRKQFRNNLFHFDLDGDAKYSNNLINSLVRYHLNMSTDEFNLIVQESFEIYIKEANKMLFNEQKLFIGTNC